MKIGMILDAPFPPDPRVENQAKVLIEHGFEVHLFCLAYRKPYNAKEGYHSIQVHRKYYPSIVYKLSALAYTLPLYHWVLRQAILKFIYQHQIDCLHVHDVQVARAIYGIRLHQQMPVILDLHENRPAIMEFYPHLNSFPGRWLISPQKWQQFEHRYIQESYRTIVVTEEAKQHYLNNVKVDEEQIVVVPNTVNPSFYTDYPVDQAIVQRYRHTFSLLYIGDTGQRRGLQTVIEAVSLLENDIPQIRFIILGKSSYDLTLKSLAYQLNVSSRIDFEGWTDPKFFQSYIIASRVGVCPILKNLHHDTTYPNKIFQYMALGRPVLVSNCDAQANAVSQSKAGGVFEEKNSKQLAAIILKLYQEPDRCHALGKNGENFVRNQFNWEITAAPLVQLYNELNIS